MNTPSNHSSLSLNIILADKYQILKSIGTGAHGEVFAAKSLKDNRRVAAKIFYRHLEEQILRYIFKELKIISSLSHPNILKVIAFGHGKYGEQIVHYLITPLMQGGNLEEIIQKKHILDIGESANIAVQIAKALAYMHANRFIHRDVKPQNILANTSMSHFVLADFGIVCEVDSQLTRAAGTIEYCAPEQMENSQKADYRLDTYGLGMTFYEMLTGVNPYREISKKQGEAAAIKCKYTSEFPLVSVYKKDIPNKLCLIVKKMIANNPDQRYINMQQVIQELEPYTTNVGQSNLITESPRISVTIEHRKTITTHPTGAYPNMLKEENKKNQSSEINDEDQDDASMSSTGTEMPRLPENINLIFEEARQLRLKKDWIAALEKYNIVLQQAPNCSQAYYGKGLLYLQSKQYQDAIVNFNLAIQNRPHSYSAYCQRSHAYLELQNFRQALLDLTRAIELFPERPEAYFYRANLYRRLAKYYLDQHQEDHCRKATIHMREDITRYEELKNEEV